MVAAARSFQVQSMSSQSSARGYARTYFMKCPMLWKTCCWNVVKRLFSTEIGSIYAICDFRLGVPPVQRRWMVLVGGKGIWEGGNQLRWWWSVVASIPHAMENREFHCGQLHSEYENGGLKRFLSQPSSSTHTLQRAQRNSSDLSNRGYP